MKSIIGIMAILMMSATVFATTTLAAPATQCAKLTQQVKIAWNGNDYNITTPTGNYVMQVHFVDVLGNVYTRKDIGATEFWYNTTIVNKKNQYVITFGNWNSYDMLIETRFTIDGATATGKQLNFGKLTMDFSKTAFPITAMDSTISITYPLADLSGVAQLYYQGCKVK
jgi:hypothetical protein